MEWVGTNGLGGYDGGWQGEKLQNLWEEYEKGETEEAKFVKDVDKLELILQMVEYERRGKGKLDLDEFIKTMANIKGSTCREWAEELIKERKILWEPYDNKPKSLRASD